MSNLKLVELFFKRGEHLKFYCYYVSLNTKENIMECYIDEEKEKCIVIMLKTLCFYKIENLRKEKTKKDVSKILDETKELIDSLTKELIEKHIPRID